MGSVFVKKVVLWENIVSEKIIAPMSHVCGCERRIEVWYVEHGKETEDQNVMKERRDITS